MPSRPPHKKYGIFAGVATVAVMLSFLFAANATLDRRASFRKEQTRQNVVDRTICLRVNRLYNVIQDTIRLAMKNTPKIEYYKTHPADLAAVQGQQRAQLKLFAPQQCPGDGEKKTKKEAR